MNNQGGFINSLLFAFILIVVSSVALYFVSQKQNHLLSLINKNGQENTSPAILLNNQKNDIEKIYTTTNETNTISTETSKDITIQLQINGSSGNSVTLKTGENAVITWNTKNASQCFSEGKGSNAWSSQERTTIGRYVASNISLTGETQFILACKSGGKTKSLTVTLNVVSSLSKLPQPSSPQPATPSTQIVPPNNNQPKKKILEKFAPMVYDDTIYSQGAPNGYRVSRKFYETHPDVYDFIVVYSAIPVGTQSASGGIVKNGIRGNGSFYPDQDDTAKFGSNGKLLGYIFIPTSLGLDAEGGIDLLGVLVHEVSHRWLMFIGDIAGCNENPNLSVKCAKAPTGFRVNESNGAHWSANVDTFVKENGVVFKNPIGGSAWQMNAGGYCSGIPATGNGVRFNDIDLYLMGFLSSNETRPIYWYDFTGDASDLGQKCTQHTISAQDIINMEGALQPAYPMAQRDFKIGFILLTAPGQSATPQQINRMNYIIDNFSVAWNEATRKKSTMNIPQ